MSSINDWESLMNGVFGSGGRFRSSASAPKEEKKSSDAGQAPAPGKAPASRQPAGGHIFSGLAAWSAGAQRAQQSSR